jgi:hypothetical protein
MCINYFLLILNTLNHALIIRNGFQELYESHGRQKKFYLKKNTRLLKNKKLFKIKNIILKNCKLASVCIEKS